MGDSNSKTGAQVELAIEEAKLTKGSSWIGTQDTFIWSECAVNRISNLEFDFTFEPAHRPEIASLRPLDWHSVAEALPTPGLAVSRESLEAAELVEAGTLRLQED